MADKFNFDETLGKLASCVANKNWHGMPEQLKKLAAHPEQEEVRSTLLDTVDYMIEHAGANYMLYTLDDLLDGTKGLTSIEGQYLQAKLVEKWEGVLAIGAKDQPDSTLSYLTGAASHMKPDDPLSDRALKRWEAMVDAQWPLTDFDLRCTLAIDHDAQNADFRHAALTRLAKVKDTESDTVLKMLTETIDHGGFYGFRDKDPESLRLIGGTLADILEAKQDTLGAKAIKDIAWKVFSQCEGCDAASEKKAARIYIAQAAPEKDPGDAFDIYQGVLGRGNPHIAEESRDAAFKILDLVDAGQVKDERGNYREVARCVAEQIFEPAVKEETRDDALAARAAETMLSLVRAELSKPDAHSASQYFNMAQSLYSYFGRGDAREAEVLKLWEGALVRSHKGSGGDDYYARQMGWMLDSAHKKGDTAQAAKAKKEWRDAIGRMTFPGEAYRVVQQIVVNAVHHAPDSPLAAEARTMLPDLEERAGIKKTPEKMGSDDFRKMIGKKRQPGFKP